MTSVNDAGVRGSGSLQQCAAAVLMVRPASFGWNAETAASNRFQQATTATRPALRDAARREFDGIAAALRAAGVRVYVVEEPEGSVCPDAVFPNNWFSLHHDGTVVLFPMLAPSRRVERRLEILASHEARGRYAVSRLLDLSHHEMSGRFLEGTGSVVFDHAARVAYACLSPRSSPSVLAELCEELGYEPVTFEATDAEGAPVYHTNVLLSIGERTAIFCAESVAPSARDAVVERLGEGGRDVVAIDRRQMGEFAGNALEVAVPGGTVLAMSERARASLDPAALEQLGHGRRIVTAPIPVIEGVGGGSVRCMLAEVFLPPAEAATGGGKA